MKNIIKSIMLLTICLSYSQESFNTQLISNWIGSNENYWPDNISDYNDIWGYESEDGTLYALIGGWDGTYIVNISSNPDSLELASFYSRFSI